MRSKLIKSEVINLFNTTKETLRYYEKEGLLHPQIDDKNYRYYDIEDIKTIRQILLFRDLGLSINELKHIFLNKSQTTYIALLKQHHKNLKDKIDYYVRLEEDLSQLIFLLEEDVSGIAFKLKTYKRRTFMIFNPFESPFLSNLKSYYDTFVDLILTDQYTEKSLISYFSYENLNDFDLHDAKMGIEVIDDFQIESDKVEMLQMDKGTYLSVFYIFEENSFDKLKNLKGEIDQYLKAMGYLIDTQDVIEIEHPEFAVILNKGQMVYELQLKVRREI